MSNRDDRIRRSRPRARRASACPAGSSSAATGALARRQSRSRRSCSPPVAASDDDDGGGGGGGGGGGKSIAISNWTGYMADQSLRRPSRPRPGIDLTYDEDINDNNEYFAKIRPNLSKGESIGRDGIVLTDWMANRLINQVKWVQPFDDGEVPEQGEPASPRSQSPGVRPDPRVTARRGRAA